MNILLRVLVGLPALLFIGIGLRWAIDPSGAAGMLGMSVMEGVGLSSQLADVGGFFICGGSFVVIGLLTSNRVWFLAPALMMAVAAIYRLLAWGIHGAPLTTDSIAIEIVVMILILLLLASKRLANDS